MPAGFALAPSLERLPVSGRVAFSDDRGLALADRGGSMTLNWRRGLFRLWAAFSVLWICGVALVSAATWRDPNRCDGGAPGPWCAYQATAQAQPSAAAPRKYAGPLDDAAKIAHPREFTDAEVFGTGVVPGSNHTPGLFDDLIPKRRAGLSTMVSTIAWGLGVPAGLYALASAVGWIAAGFRAPRARNEAPPA